MAGKGKGAKGKKGSTKRKQDTRPKLPNHTLSLEESTLWKDHMEEAIAKNPVHTPECGHPNLDRDLEDCGNNLCWAIAVMDSIASTLSIKGGNYELIKLNCDKLMVDCHEGSDYPPIIIKAFKHMKEHNISKDSYYPGESLKDKLPDNIPEEVKALRLKGFEMVDHRDEFAIMHAVQKGPVVAGVRNSPEFIMLGDKIYKGSDNELVIGGKYCNHGLVVFGWGEKKDTRYWNVKNSDGTRWGNAGCGRIARHSSLPGHMNPLLTNIMYPVFE